MSRWPMIGTVRRLTQGVSSCIARMRWPWYSSHSSSSCPVIVDPHTLGLCTPVGTLCVTMLWKFSGGYLGMDASSVGMLCVTMLWKSLD